MAADVGYFVRVGNDNETAGGAATKSTALITRDLLGGCSTLDSKELDLDLQVPSGWEKRLDLKSGKVYLQKCNSPNSSSEHKHHQTNQTVAKQHQDLNFPPTSKQPLNLFNDTNLDLKLVSSPSSSGYQSVCTLDKVKFALERAEKETIRKRPMSASKSTSPYSNSSSSSVQETTEIEYDQDKSSTSYAAGCPNCLLYVLISKSNPKCPRCNSIVPSPTTMKKPRIDLNI